MTSMIKFIDANIFIERWSNEKVKSFIDTLEREKHATSILVLAEVYHKLKKKNIKNTFEYIRAIMGAIHVYDFIQDDLFTAMKNDIGTHINDRIHIATMKRKGITNIISFDTDFDKDKTIVREIIS
jgi:predicted nucleic acid-binding protein